MGPLLHSCVEVRTTIELSFGVMNGIGINVLDGVHMPEGKGLFLGFFFWHLRPHSLNGQNEVLFAEKCIRLVCEKLTIFLYRQDIVGNVILLAF